LAVLVGSDITVSLVKTSLRAHCCHPQASSGSFNTDRVEEWTIQDLGALGEFVGSIAVLATLACIAVRSKRRTLGILNQPSVGM
jgi:hypothetical protein